jgi:HlyD family secretion protein
MRASACGTLATTVAVLLVAGIGCGGAAPGGATAAPPTGPSRVTALGRLQPRDGIHRIAGPSRPSVVIAKLLVDEGARVESDQPIAVLDTIAADEAGLARAKAELANARTALERLEPLVKSGMVSVQVRDDAQLKVDVARAELAAAQSAYDADTVRAPTAGRIIAIHARRGERVGPDGIAELAETDQMYAVAEVYETDIGRVKLGQHATLKSPALPDPLTGAVDRIGQKIGKLDLLDADPVARTDARVVDVRIRLDDSPRAASLSNLQVEVAIEP